MEHWGDVLPGKIIRVNYEDVVNNLEGEVKRLFKFLDLPFEDNCLDFYNNTRAIRTPSSEQVRQPIYVAGLEQWKQYENYLGNIERDYTTWIGLRLLRHAVIALPIMWDLIYYFVVQYLAQ